MYEGKNEIKSQYTVSPDSEEAVMNHDVSRMICLRFWLVLLSSSWCSTGYVWDEVTQ